MKYNLTLVQKFKHDTVGKFQNIKELVELINEDNFTSEESQEILIELNKVFKKMVIASEKIILSDSVQ